MRLIASAYACFLLVLPLGAVAAGPSPSLNVATLEIGAPIPFAQCEVKKISRSYSSYKYDAVRPCWRFDGIKDLKNRPGQPLPEEASILLDLTEDRVPRPLHRSDIKATIVAGKIEAVIIRTSGLEDQAEVLDMLTVKYGKPTSVDRVDLQNAHGASYQSVDAKWEFDDLRVSFLGLAGRTDLGGVIIKSPRAIEWENAREAEAKAAAPKL